MPKLNQILAIEKGVKSKVHSQISEIYKIIQRKNIFDGFTRTYQAIDEDGESLPPENSKVQCIAPEVLEFLAKEMEEYFDVTYKKDLTNCLAVVDVKIKDQVFLEKVPATYLLFLEKQLNDIRTFINTLPTLDESVEWTLDSKVGVYKSETVKTHRNKKVQKPIVLYPATDKHPAQTNLITEDVLAGYWNQQKFSGALSKKDKENLIEKVETILKAVKMAREEANSVDVPKDIQNIGEKIFQHLLG